MSLLLLLGISALIYGFPSGIFVQNEYAFILLTILLLTLCGLFSQKPIYHLLKHSSDDSRINCVCLRRIRIFILRFVRAFFVASRKSPLLQFTLALAGWITGFASMAFILFALQLDVSLAVIISSLFVIIFGSIIPLPALGITGGGELGLAALLLAHGFAPIDAVSLVLVFGSVHLLTSLVLGCLWFSFDASFGKRTIFIILRGHNV